MKWMRSTRVYPRDFVIFCWLLPSLSPRPLVVGIQRARALIKTVRKDGWPFTLRLAVAAEPESIFPERFATNVSITRTITKADLLHFHVADFESDEDDEFEGPDLFD